VLATSNGQYPKSGARSGVESRGKKGSNGRVTTSVWDAVSETCVLPDIMLPENMPKQKLLR
jgi:hypothetical protein